MPKIAVCHPSFATLGGAESVCMNIVEALSTEYEVTLISTSDPDISVLNGYFNTNVSNIKTREIRFPAQVAETVSALSKYTIGTDVPRLREALFKRYVQQISGEFDLVISTRNELCVPDNDSAQYIHLPRGGIIYDLGRKELPESGMDVPWYVGLYDSICKRLENYNIQCVSDSILITNSEWTSELIEQIYDVTPHVVYPPVDDSAFSPDPWDERENGFVMIGKVCEEKRTLAAIEFIDQLRDKGHEVHLHIIGPYGNLDYADRVRAAADQRQYVDIMGTVSRERLIRMICTHKYGFHAMEQEHFGMAVAELITGGAIPFVPNSGGQVYIVNNELLTYNSLTEAVKNAGKVHTDADLQREVHSGLLERATRYQKANFKDNIKSIVENSI